MQSTVSFSQQIPLPGLTPALYSAPAPSPGLSSYIGGPTANASRAVATAPSAATTSQPSSPMTGSANGQPHSSDGPSLVTISTNSPNITTQSSTCITQRRPSRSTDCSNVRYWQTVSCPHGYTGRLARRCRRCDGCLAWRRLRTKARVKHGVEQLWPAAHLTLTSKPRTSWRQMMSWWTHMVEDLRLSQPNIEYTCIKEAGPRRGMKHLHVILAPWIEVPQNELSAMWERVSGAKIVWIEWVYGRDPAEEAAKYVAKHLRGVRKNVTYSEGWPELPKEESALLMLFERCQTSALPAVRYQTASGILLEESPSCDCWGEVY